MYPQGLYGNPQRPYQLFGPDGFLRNIPAPVAGQGLSEAHALAWNLRRTMNDIASFLDTVLPSDCPVIFGGGLIRDGLFGARPGDIDVWLPANITVPHILAGRPPREDPTGGTFIGHLAASFGINNIGPFHTIFNAPAGFNLAVPAEAENPYRDMTNHWVVSGQINNFPVQFMRTNVPWENDPQDFMNRLMRNFDLDFCMFFLCVERGSESVDTARSTEFVIAPNALLDVPDGAMWSQLGWNTARNVTSEARRQARIDKLRGKYFFQPGLQDIAPEDIVAAPIPVGLIFEQMVAYPLPVLEAPIGGTARPVLQTETQGVAGDTVRLNDGAAVGIRVIEDDFGVSPVTDRIFNIS